MVHPPKSKDWMPLAVMTGKTKSGATLGLALADGDSEGDCDALGETLADGETLGL